MHSSLYLMFIETHPPPEQKYDINEKMMEYRTFIFSYKATTYSQYRNHLHRDHTALSMFIFFDEGLI